MGSIQRGGENGTDLGGEIVKDLIEGCGNRKKDNIP